MSATFGATLVEVIPAMREMMKARQREGSRRAIFLSLYMSVTDAIGQRVREGGFQDPVWVERYGVAFANLYLRAVDSYASGTWTPKAWRRAFDCADNRSALVLQDLLLGVNAHINHDLALALIEAGIDDRRDERYADHTSVNAVLESLTNQAQQQIAEAYAPGLANFDALGGDVDEMVAAFSIARAREHAWAVALSLANARNPFERKLIMRGLDVQADVLARLILIPGSTAAGRKAWTALEQAPGVLDVVVKGFRV